MVGFLRQSIGVKMKIRLGKPAVNNFKAYQKQKPKSGGYLLRKQYTDIKIMEYGICG